MLLIYNALIHTLDARHPRASAIAIDQGRILEIGEDNQILARFGALNPDAYNAGGSPILPGLIDAHLHLEHYALGLQKVDCETATYQECLQRVAERASRTPAGDWVLGHGWNQNNWPGGYGSAADLDKIAPDNPVFLTAKSLHAAWANSEALRQAGLTSDSFDPEGGRLGRDEKGNLNGILFETAMDLIYDILPEPETSQVMKAIQTAQPVLWRLGLTGVHDYDRKRCFVALQELNKEGLLHLRVVKGIPLEDLPEAAKIGLRTGFGNDFLRIGSVKAFADGALGPQTAAMLQPYEGDDSNRGMLMMDAEELFEQGRLASQNGLSLAVHAIGDRANHEVIQAYAQLRDFEKAQGLPALRHRIEHVQLLHPSDVPRLAELGLVASMQPIHATSDMLMADRYWGDRAAYSYAWRMQVEQGAVLAFGSDAPVESPNPFLGLHAAVTRQRLDGTPGPQGWYPEQRLSVEEALSAYTYGAAYAAGMEDRLGKLAPGYLADLVILDQDPFTCPPENLAGIQCQATMIGGEWVWRQE